MKTNFSGLSAIVAICVSLAACQSPCGAKKNGTDGTPKLNAAEKKLVGLWETHSSLGSEVIWRKPDRTFVQKSIRKWDVDSNKNPKVKTDSGRWSVEVSWRKVPFKERKDHSVGVQCLKIEEEQFVHYSGDYCHVVEKRVRGDSAKEFEGVKLYFDDAQWDTPDCQGPYTATMWYVMKYNP